MKKTTVWIDEALLAEAMESAGASSIREVVETGLRALVRDRRREALRRELGTFEIDLASDELERLRNGN
jgi:Arc/MetJ family transcription regulator